MLHVSPSADVIFNKNLCALSGFVFCPVTKQAVVGERWLSPGRRLTHLNNGRMESKTRRGGEAFLSFSTLKFPAHFSTEKGCSGNTS